MCVEVGWGEGGEGGERCGYARLAVCTLHGHQTGRTCAVDRVDGVMLAHAQLHKMMKPYSLYTKARRFSKSLYMFANKQTKTSVSSQRVQTNFHEGAVAARNSCTQIKLYCNTTKYLSRAVQVFRSSNEIFSDGDEG